jgi:hypothetical protein
VVGVARFVDAGALDPKWICSDRPPSALDRLQIDAFFHLYALAKRLLNRARARGGVTRYDGLELRESR